MRYAVIAALLACALTGCSSSGTTAGTTPAAASSTTPTTTAPTTTGPPTSGPGADYAYLGKVHAIRDLSITVTTDADLIAAAHSECDALAKGLTAQAIVDQLTKSGISAATARTVLQASVETYCPMYKAAIGQ